MVIILYTVGIFLILGVGLFVIGRYLKREYASTRECLQTQMKQSKEWLIDARKYLIINYQDIEMVRTSIKRLPPQKSHKNYTRDLVRLQEQRKRILLHLADIETFVDDCEYAFRIAAMHAPSDFNSADSQRMTSLIIKGDYYIQKGRQLKVYRIVVVLN